MSPFRLSRNRAMLILSSVQGLASLQFYVPVSALFLTSRGLTYSDIFLLEAVLLAALLLAEVPTGAIADRMNRKTALIIGYGLGAAGEVLFACGGNLWMYIVSFTLSGISIATLSGAEDAYIYESLGADADVVATAAYGRLSAVTLVAGVASAGTGSLLASIDIGLPAVCAAVAHVGAAVVVTRLPAHAADLNEEEEGPRGDIRAAVVTMLRTPVLLYGAFASGTGYVIFNAVHTLNQPMFGAAGIPVGWFGPIAAGGMLLAALANHSIGRIEARVGRVGLLIGATLSGAVGYGLLAIAQPAVVVCGFVVIVVCMNLRGPVLSAIVNRLVGNAQRATVLSVMSSTGSLVGMGVNLVLGAITDRAYSAAALAAGCMLTVLGLAWLPVAARHLTAFTAGEREDGSEDAGRAAA